MPITNLGCFGIFILLTHSFGMGDEDFGFRLNQDTYKRKILLAQNELRTGRSRGSSQLTEQFYPSKYEPSCGQRLARRERHARILNGRMAINGEFPWQISLQQRGRAPGSSWIHICGASLISKSAALSAAHCFAEYLTADYRVVIGMHTLNENNFSEQIFDLHEGDFVRHRGFGLQGEFDNDIAFIRLHGPDDGVVDFDSFVQPICLPDKGMQFPPETLCYISGWGALDKRYPNRTSLTLQGARVPLNSPDVCEAAYEQKDHRDNYLRRLLIPRRKQSVITEGNICAGYIGGDLDYANPDAPDSCYGDSGGPLACSLPENPETFYLVGIVSWGKECGSSTHPGIYTKVAHYVNWVENEISLSRSGFENHGIFAT